jgi:hypothetical protein
MSAEITAKIKRKIARMLSVDAPPAEQQSILSQYRDEFPNQQVGVNIFEGEWSSAFPEKYGIHAGSARLFEDGRIAWILEKLGTLKDYEILELGPLEGAHTYMLDQTEARSILAIEANTRAYLKCLITKEVTKMSKSSFLCGDFCKYLERCDRHFDLVCCSGILYHMENPVKLIADIAAHSDRIFIWTHYFDALVLQKFPGKFDLEGTELLEYKGFQCTLHKQYYQQALGWGGFCGGMKPFSYWMEREEILNCLKYFGFTNIAINGETKEHQNGPCFTLLAKKENQVRL